MTLQAAPAASVLRQGEPCVAASQAFARRLGHDLDEHYQCWNDARSARRNAEAYELLQAARKRVAENTSEDWEWLKNALADASKKWFVAWLFVRQPIPRRLFSAMMRAAVVDVDASSNKWMLAPCLETFGRKMVVEELERLREDGIATEDGLKQASYWLGRYDQFARGTRPEGE
jgi:hypothetical protein